MLKAPKLLNSISEYRKRSLPTDAVCQVRAKLNLTQEQMAQQLKCSVSTVRDMEQKQRLPGTHALKDNFARLAQQAGFTVQSGVATKDEFHG